MIRSRIIAGAISLLVFTLPLSGCLNNNSPIQWNKTNNEKFGITAKQGFAQALTKINETYSNSSSPQFLSEIKCKDHDVTRFGKASFWRFFIWISINDTISANLQIDIFSNGTKVVREFSRGVFIPPGIIIQNWTVDSDKAITKALEKSDIKDFVNRDGVYVGRMYLKPNNLSYNWDIAWNIGTLSTPSEKSIIINASE
jgi:hypothetical protein